MQQLGGRLELLVLEQPPHERVARIFLLALDSGRGLGPRQQRPRLDVDERRRHHEEFTRHVQIELVHQAQRLQILGRDERDRDVVDADLVLLDEVQQQIERALEVLEPDRHGVLRRFEVVGFVHHRYEIFIASLDAAHGLDRDPAGALAAVEQDLLEAVRIGQRRLPPLADRIEVRIERAGELRLDLDIADLALPGTGSSGRRPPPCSG